MQQNRVVFYLRLQLGMSDERKRQRSTSDPDEYDAHVSDTPSEKKKKQEDDESSEKVYQKFSFINTNFLGF